MDEVRAETSVDATLVVETALGTGESSSVAISEWFSTEGRAKGCNSIRRGFFNTREDPDTGSDKTSLCLRWDPCCTITIAGRAVCRKAPEWAGTRR